MLEFKDTKPLQIRAIPEHLRGRSVRLALFTETHDVKMEFVPSTDDEPTSFWVSQDMAQQLADDLYRCGVRPSEAAGSAGAMAATQEHLKDLRRLLFDDSRTKMVIMNSLPQGI